MPTKRPWIKNGKPVTKNGSPVVCNECPCASQGECEARVSSTVSALLEEIDPNTQQTIWQLVGSYTSTFVCAQWEEESNSGGQSTWRLVSPSQGTLLMAVKHNGLVEFDYDPVAFISATVLYNMVDGYYKIVGCKCSVLDHACVLQFATLDNFDIAGLVPVYVPEDGSDSDSSPDWGTYEITDVCRLDQCESYKTWLTAFHNWYGGELHGEGFVDWWDGGHPETEWNLIEWYHISKHLMAWVYQTADCQRHYVSIQCPCDGLNARTLTETHRLHDFAGICDMEDNCALEVMCHMRWYLDLQADASTSDSSTSGICPSPNPNPLWEEIGFYNGDFQCAEWSNESGSWVRTKAPSGNFVMAYPYALPDGNNIFIGNEAIYACGTAFIVAGVIRNTQTGQYKLFGCQCTDSYYHQCTHYYTQLDGYIVGGTAPVNQTEGYECEPDWCLASRLYMTAMHTWHPETILRSEGIVDWINQYGVYSFTKFKMGLQWGADASDSDSDSSNNGYLMYEPCDNCGCYLSTLSLDGKSIIELAGICNEECDKYFALRASARKHGWEWHEEGLWVGKLRTNTNPVIYSDWWQLPQSAANMHGRISGDIKCVAINGDVAYEVHCNCTFHTRYLTQDSYGVDVPLSLNYWRYIEYEGACNCIDVRELALNYPDVFGITDISYGNNTVIRGTNIYHSSDPMAGDYTTISETTMGDHTNDNKDMYWEKRAMCLIYKVLDDNGNVRYGYGMMTPEGSPIADKWRNQNYSYSTAEFTGHAMPFTRNVIGDMDWTWSGRIVSWEGGGMGYAPSECYTSSQDAWDYATSGRYLDPQTPFCTNGDAHPLTARLSPPYFGEEQMKAAKVEYNPRLSKPYCGYKAVWVKGQVRSDETWPDSKYYVNYREQWIETNEGLLRKGLSSYEASFFLYGYVDHGGISGSNCGYPRDTTITAQVIDTDMHPCEGHEVDWQNESNSESEL